MKKVLFLCFGLAIVFASYAASNSEQTTKTSISINIGITVNSGEIYNVAVYELKHGNGTVVIKKTIQAQYDAETGEIIIDGRRYRKTYNPQYGKDGAGTFGKYKYMVADKYYFNWEYEGNGRFRDQF